MDKILPVDVQNKTLALDVNRKRIEIAFLKSELSSLQEIASNSSTSSLGSNEAIARFTDSSLNTLATILTMSLDNPITLAPSTESSGDGSEAALLDIENITLNLDINRLNREISYLR
jgi:hypothetical protein